MLSIKGQTAPLIAGTRFYPARMLATSNESEQHPFHPILKDAFILNDVRPQSKPHRCFSPHKQT